MLPHKHFLFSGAATLLIAAIFFPEIGVSGIIKWALAGALISALIDIDVMVIVQIKARKDKRLRNLSPKYAFKDFNGFIDALAKAGILKIALATHLALSIFASILAYFFAGNYFIPALIGVISHLITDIPYLKKVFGVQ